MATITIEIRENPQDIPLDDIKVALTSAMLDLGLFVKVEIEDRG